MRVAKELVAINDRIAQLEYSGYRVTMSHIRFEDAPEEYGDTRNFVHGITVFNIRDENMMKIYRGRAYCSVADVFDKVEGARIAFGRAITAMKEQFGREYLTDIFSR